jgi:ATP-binding protein involved in chromosome partitioning
MTTQALKRAVSEALTAVTLPDSGTDIVASGHVKDLVVDEEGVTRFSFQLRPDDPGDLVKRARTAAEAVSGVTAVKINVQLPQTGGHGAKGEHGGGGGLKPGSVPAPTPQPDLLPAVEHVIAVSSGKGGVGKSMVASNLAVALARAGKRVGLLDADIYGPDIPAMFGETRRPRVGKEGGRDVIEPLEAHGVRLMSLGFLLEKDQPAIMRGPLISGLLKQFVEQVSWGELDFLVVDLPPGTGDAQLSLVQTIDVDGAVMVTTPQDVATGDVRRAVRMFERVNTRVLGIVENMAGFACPHCNEVTDVFGRGGGERLAEELGVEFLGRVPLDVAVARAGDEGAPTVASAPESPAAVALTELARRVGAAVKEG